MIFNPASIKVRCLILLLTAVALSACGNKEKEQELKKYVEKQREITANAPKNQLLANLKLPTPITYQRSIRTDSGATTETNKAVFVKNPLSIYPLKALEFVGVVKQNNQLMAYILAPDKKIYSVKEGGIIGNNNGKIVKIDGSHIEVMESFAEPGKQPVMRKEILQLKEKGG